MTNSIYKVVLVHHFEDDTSHDYCIGEFDTEHEAFKAVDQCDTSADNVYAYVQRCDRHSDEVISEVEVEL